MLLCTNTSVTKMSHQPLKGEERQQHLCAIIHNTTHTLSKYKPGFKYLLSPDLHTTKCLKVTATKSPVIKTVTKIKIIQQTQEQTLKKVTKNLLICRKSPKIPHTERLWMPQLPEPALSVPV